MISRDETERLAAMANALRPDWPLKSLTTFIVNELTRRTYREVAIALAWVATDPVTATPKRVLEAGEWWTATRTQSATVSVIATRCGEHPHHRALHCPECDQEGSAAPERVAEYVAQIQASIRELNTQRHHAKGQNR